MQLVAMTCLASVMLLVMPVPLYNILINASSPITKFLKDINFTLFHEQFMFFKNY